MIIEPSLAVNNSWLSACTQRMVVDTQTPKNQCASGGLLPIRKASMGPSATKHVMIWYDGSAGPRVLVEFFGPRVEIAKFLPDANHVERVEVEATNYEQNGLKQLSELVPDLAPKFTAFLVEPTVLEVLRTVGQAIWSSPMASTFLSSSIPGKAADGYRPNYAGFFKSL